MNTMVLRILVVSACCSVFCWGDPAQGQMRRSTGNTIKHPGSFSTIGAGQSSLFRTSSAGGGGLQRTGSGYQSRGVLRSSISNNVGAGQGLRSNMGFGANRGGTAALRSKIDRHSAGLIGGSSSVGGVGAATLTAVRKGSNLKSKDGGSVLLGGLGGQGMANAVLGRGMSLAAAREFIASVGQSSSLQKSDEAVRTLMPDQPGQYRDKMHRGEELLKAGSFMSAYDNFKLASDIASRSPEPFLNMAHARFGMGSYGMTAHYIRRALVSMPSLPQVQLRPKSFYGNIAVFGDLVIRLEGYLDETPRDGDALLILAYFRWFADNPDVPAVRSMLERALAVAKSEDRIEAIQIFWRAIVASKKATGELRTAGAAAGVSSDIKSTTRPSGKAPDSADKTPKSPPGSPATSDSKSVPPR